MADMADIPERPERMSDELLSFAKAIEEEPDPEVRAILEKSQADARALARGLAANSARAEVAIADALARGYRQAIEARLFRVGRDEQRRRRGWN